MFIKTTFIVLLTLSMASAWWEVGHMMTAQVAQQQLKKMNPEVLDWANCLVSDFNILTDGRSNTFVEAAVWADDIKETGTNYLDNWHYTDRPINNDGALIILDPISITYNSVDAMKRAKSVFTNYKTLKLNHTWAKAQMIREILHIVGDMHQPLHNSNFYNGTFKTGDAGGNLVKVYRLDNGALVNLHSYWDSGAFQLQPSDDYLVRPLNQSAVSYMENLAETLMLNFPTSSFQSLDMITPDVWTQEGFHLSQNIVYPAFTNTNKISEEYHLQAGQIVNRQIVLGGYRLAAFLTDIYKTMTKLQSETGFVESKLNSIGQKE